MTHLSKRGGSGRRGGRRRTPAAIDARTDLLEAQWGSLPVMEESLGMRVRVESINLSRLSGEVLA